MASKLTWSTPSAWVELLGGTTGIATASLASNAAVLGAVYTNVGNQQLADFAVYIRNTAAPTVAGIIDVYLVQEVSTGVYETASASDIPAKSPIGTILLKSVATAQVITLQGVLIPPSNFKILMVNRSNGALTALDSENKITIRTYSPEGQ